MNTQQTEWKTTLATAGALFSDDGMQVYFKNETQTSSNSPKNLTHLTTLTPLVHLGSVLVTGTDAQAFLHSQFTNDVNHLQTGQAQHTAWCTAKGRMLGNLINYPTPEGYRLVLSRGLVSGILKRLKMFVLRSQVKLEEEMEERVCLGLSGTTASTLLAQAGFAVDTLPHDGMASQNLPEADLVRLTPERYMLVVQAHVVVRIWDALIAAGAQPVGTAVWTWQDIRDALPWITPATQEEFVPQMVDFEKIGGVSFHKGCYPGQEIVARAQYLGKVKRHLYRLKSPVPLQAGEELYSPLADQPGQVAGKVVLSAPDPESDSGADFVALAVLLEGCAPEIHQGSPSGPQLAASAVHSA